MMKKIAMLLVLLFATGACSGGKPQHTPGPLKTDDAGHAIAAGTDWSGTGGAQKGDKVGAQATPISSALYAAIKCGVPPTLSPEQKKSLPPNFDPYSGFPPAKNDFPLTASISPKKGDPGSTTTITAVATGQPGALIVIVARFFDGRHHGMRAAKFADALGHVALTGPIPTDAPVGLATIAVSASTQQKKSALRTVQFIVTGQGCQ